MRPSPFSRVVNPVLGGLLEDLWLDRSYVRGEDHLLYDEAGRAYFDLVSGFGAQPFGATPQIAWDALLRVRDSREPNLVQPSLLRPATQLAERLLAISPIDEGYAIFANSGAEAVEAALKLARARTGRPRFIATRGGFHGKTFGALAVTGTDIYRTDFEPMLPGVDHVPFGDLAALESALDQRGSEVAGFLVEPIQGEGGVVIAPPGYLAEARRLCHRAGALFIVDEIQTGLGRTGSMLALDETGVVPDILLLGKALGGGLIPIGVCLYGASVFSAAMARNHSSTFAGNTLACRVALAVMDALEEEDRKLIRGVRQSGEIFRRGLDELARRYPRVIREARGRGYMLGLELQSDCAPWASRLWQALAQTKNVAPIAASYLLNVEGLRVMPTLNAAQVLRIQPPLTLPGSQIQPILSALDRAFDVLSSGDAGRVFGSILDRRPRESRPIPRPCSSSAREPTATDGRFCFLVHPLTDASYAEVDPSLKSLSGSELERVARALKLADEPLLVSRFRVESRSGACAFGELIGVGFTARDVREHPQEAEEAVRAAYALACSRGAQVVGLGGYTSIVTLGGAALAPRAVPITTGNAYTAVAAVDGVDDCMGRLGRLPARECAAVLGAAGSIGRLVSGELAERFARLRLLGSGTGDPSDVARLRRVAAGVCQHLRALHEAGEAFLEGSLAQRLIASERLPPRGAPVSAFFPCVDWLVQDGYLTLGPATAANLREADVIVTATSSPEAFLGPAWLAQGAIVCDVSRPGNVHRDVARLRPDCTVFDGALVRTPPGFDTEAVGLPARTAFACMAETAMLALEPELTPRGSGSTAASPARLREAAARLGFSLAPLRRGDELLFGRFEP